MFEAHISQLVITGYTHLRISCTSKKLTVPQATCFRRNYGLKTIRFSKLG